MSESIDTEEFKTQPKLRIVKAIIKDKDGNIIGEHDYEHETR